MYIHIIFLIIPLLFFNIIYEANPVIDILPLFQSSFATIIKMKRRADIEVTS